MTRQQQYTLPVASFEVIRCRRTVPDFKADIDIVGACNAKEFFGHAPGTVLCTSAEYDGNDGRRAPKIVFTVIGVNVLYSCKDFRADTLEKGGAIC